MRRRRAPPRARKKAPNARTAEEAWDRVIHALALEDAENGDSEDTEETHQWAQRLAERVRAQVAEQLLRSAEAKAAEKPAPPTGGEEATAAAGDESRLKPPAVHGRGPATN